MHPPFHWWLPSPRRSPPPKWAKALSRRVGVARGDPPPFPFLHPHCSALLLTAALLIVASHHRCLLLPFKWRQSCTLTSSLIAANLEPESLANDAEWIHFLRHHLTPTALPLTTMLCPPSAEIWLLEGPPEFHIPLRLLHHWWLLDHAAIELFTAAVFLIVAPSLQWMPRRPTTPNQFPVDSMSSPAKPCPALAAGWPNLASEATCGKGEGLSPMSGSGPKCSSGPSPIAQNLFPFLFQINSIQIQI
jgi:hypothetical protein